MVSAQPRRGPPRARLHGCPAGLRHHTPVRAPACPPAAARHPQPSGGPQSLSGIATQTPEPCSAPTSQLDPSPRTLYTDNPDSDLTPEIARLSALLSTLSTAGENMATKTQALQACSLVSSFLKSKEHAWVAPHLTALTPLERCLLLTLPAIRQQHLLSVPPSPQSGGAAANVAAQLEALRGLATWLGAVDVFYSSLGGVVGYQLKCLELIREGGEQPASEADTGSDAGSDASSSVDPSVRLHLPNGPNLASGANDALADELAAEGLAALPRMAEIYPLGGAGDRLGLLCDVTGEPLPAALLPYAGRPLLHSLVRDLQAREYLHYRVFGAQHTTPVAIMTSPAKGNHGRISKILREAGYFGRGEGSFRLFCQPEVPVVGCDGGKWLLKAPCTPLGKPGGHGAIWKLMLDHGVFDWLYTRKAEGAVVRQISNPMAGTDFTLLALSGTGYSRAKSFGFASCERVVGAAEGMNVLLERFRPSPPSSPRDGASSASEGAYQYGVTNIEYTEFERLGIPDVPVTPGSNVSAFPANTNILYVGLKAVEGAVRAGVAAGGGAALPGMIFNTKKSIEYTDATAGGAMTRVRAGRLECTMQNLADSLTVSFEAPTPQEAHSELPTFVLFGRRRKVTSSAKRKLAPGSTRLHQTPDGSFYDLMKNAAEMLAMCDVTTPPVPSVEEYLAAGPGFIFLFHPALGPLWKVVAQKLRRGAVCPGAEVVLDIAELAWEDVHVSGSLLLIADAPMGASPGGALRMGEGCPRARLRNVRVDNAGVDWDAPGNQYWKHAVTRREACVIELRGDAQVEAQDVTIPGDAKWVVPAGHRLLLSQAADGRSVREELMPLEKCEDAWTWQYSMVAGGGIQLRLQEGRGDVAHPERERPERAVYSK